MADIIQIRRDLAANWTSVNPVLANGEFGFETDTGQLKLGDGATAWTSLVYIDAPLTGQNNFTKTNTWQMGAPLASATNVTLGSDGNAFHITGTTTITDFTAPTGVPSAAVGPFQLITDAACPLTHASGVLEIQGGASITTVANDMLLLWQDGTTWRLAQLGGGGVFATSYQSAEQTITAAGALTLAHSLGAMPTLIQARLKCGTVQGNYSIGDEVIINIADNTWAGGAQRGLQITPDSTNLNVRYANTPNTFSLLNKTTGTAFLITNSYWKLIVVAWA